MVRDLIALCSAGIVLSVATPLHAGDGTARTQPAAAISFQEQISRADSETLSRMLIERKAERARLSAHGAADVSQLDEELAQISTHLQSRLSEGNNADVTEAAPVVAFFPRIVKQAAAPMASPAASGGTASVNGGSASAAASPSRFGSQEDPADAAVRRRFEESISVTFKNERFEQALAAIEQQSHVPIHVNWNALAAAGVDQNTSITFSLQNASGSRLLLRLLTECIPNGNIGYTIDDHGVIVSTRDDLNSTRYQVTRVYDVRDLLTPGAMNYLPAELLWQMRNVQVTNLSDTLKAVVAPDSWRDNGGTIGSIREFNGLLIINQTKDNHLEIEELLSQIRSHH